MNTARPFVIAVGLILGGQLTFAQDLTRYRADALDSSLDSVVAARCGQHWDTARLAADAAWTVDRDRVARRGTEGNHDAALSRDSRATRLGGRP